MNVHAAVDPEVCAGNKRSLIGAEKVDERGNFVRLAEAADGICGRIRLCITSSGTDSIIEVAKPGDTVLTVTPGFPTPSASDSLKPWMPAFATA